jgi:hypothetical protein
MTDEDGIIVSFISSAVSILQGTDFEMGQKRTKSGHFSNGVDPFSSGAGPGAVFEKGTRSICPVRFAQRGSRKN